MDVRWRRGTPGREGHAGHAGPWSVRWPPSRRRLDQPRRRRRRSRPTAPSPCRRGSTRSAWTSRALPAVTTATRRTPRPAWVGRAARQRGRFPSRPVRPSPCSSVSRAPTTPIHRAAPGAPAGAATAATPLVPLAPVAAAGRGRPGLHPAGRGRRRRRRRLQRAPVRGRRRRWGAHGRFRVPVPGELARRRWGNADRGRQGGRHPRHDQHRGSGRQQGPGWRGRRRHQRGILRRRWGWRGLLRRRRRTWRYAGRHRGGALRQWWRRLGAPRSERERGDVEDRCEPRRRHRHDHLLRTRDEHGYRGRGTSSGGATSSTPATVTPPPAALPLAPSSTFAFARVRLGVHQLRLGFDYPVRGKLDVLVTTRTPGASAARQMRVGRLHDSAVGPETHTLRVPLTHRGQSMLGDRGKLPIRLTLVFTPDRGQPSQRLGTYTMRSRYDSPSAAVPPSLDCSPQTYHCPPPAELATCWGVLSGSGLKSTALWTVSVSGTPDAIEGRPDEWGDRLGGLFLACQRGVTASANATTAAGTPIASSTVQRPGRLRGLRDASRRRGRRPSDGAGVVPLAIAGRFRASCSWSPTYGCFRRRRRNGSTHTPARRATGWRSPEP